ncbi:hypothetical protein DYB34_011596, partial [Aphanomyces astaci]
MERYFRYEAVGDQFTGRVVAGLQINSSDFAVLPPHFRDPSATVVLSALQVVFPLLALNMNLRPVLQLVLASLDIRKGHQITTLREQGNLDVTGAIVRLLGRAKKTAQGVHAEFNTLGDLSVAEPPSNTTNHRTTVPKTRAVRDLVRTFIPDRSVTRTRTVGKDVLAPIQEHNVVSVDVSCKKSYGFCLRAVQSYLAKQGYARGKRVGATKYRMSKAHEDARDAYVGMMVPTVMMSPRRPVVYLDESFVHHHYSSHADSLYHPDDPKTKSKHK